LRWVTRSTRLCWKSELADNLLSDRSCGARVTTAQLLALIRTSAYFDSDYPLPPPLAPSELGFMTIGSAAEEAGCSPRVLRKALLGLWVGRGEQVRRQDFLRWKESNQPRQDTGWSLARVAAMLGYSTTSLEKPIRKGDLTVVVARGPHQMRREIETDSLARWLRTLRRPYKSSVAHLPVVLTLRGAAEETGLSPELLRKAIINRDLLAVEEPLDEFLIPRCEFDRWLTARNLATQPAEPPLRPSRKPSS
jgi:hypothetical protein